MDSASVIDTLKKSTVVDFLPTSERQARPLTSLEPEEQVEAWKRVITSTPEGKITAAIVLKFLIIYKVPQLWKKSTIVDKWFWGKG